MASRSIPRLRSRPRDLARVEPLEPRLALAVNVLSPLPDLTRPSTATTETISVADRFDDPDVTGSVVQFKVNTAAPNDLFFVELFDQAGPGRTRTTPGTVNNFLAYVDDGSYANTIIHRSIPGFIVQGGGFKAPTAASNQPGGTPATITAKPAVPNEPGNTNVRGTIAMAKIPAEDDFGNPIPGGGPDSATNQWFFNLGNNAANLDAQNGGFTAFGRVLGNGMTAVDAMAALPTFDATALYGGAFDDLPLRNPTDPVQPAQFVTLPSISRVGELVYTVTSSDPSLVAASFLPGSGGTSLQLEHKPDKSGTAVITVRAASVFDPTNFKEDSFTVERQAPPPTAPGAPSVATGVPVNGRVNLSWTVPASNGGAAISDYVVQHSSDNGANWTTFNDGTSTATSAVVTGLTNGTNYVFRVAAVNSAGAGAFAAASATVTPRAVFAVGAEIGGGAPVVRLVNAATGAAIAEATAFEAGFRGGARVAMGDVDGDGIPEVVAASGPGRVGEIRVFRQQVTGGATTLQELAAYRTQPFGARYTGGVEIAVGDVDGDGREDLVAAMSRGAGTVNVFRSVNAADPIQNTAYRTFTPFGPTFDGGASVAVADVGTFTAGALVSATAADGKVEIVVGSGPGMRSTVRVYDISATPRVVTTILPFSASMQGGVTVAAGRYRETASIDDIVVSSGRGGRSEMRVFNGRVGQTAPEVLASSAAFAALGRPNAPVFTAPIDLDGDGKIDRFHATQGDAVASAGVLNVLANGTSAGQLGSLRGPLRIAAPRRG